MTCHFGTNSPEGDWKTSPVNSQVPSFSSHLSRLLFSLYMRIIEVWSEKVERILSKAISLEILYNKRMAKRIEGFSHICSQDIHQFLSVDSWFQSSTSLSKVVWQLWCLLYAVIIFSDRELDHSDRWLTYWAHAQLSSLWWQGTWWDNSSSPAVCHLFQTLASTLPFSTCKAISPAWYSCCWESHEGLCFGHFMNDKV